MSAAFDLPANPVPGQIATLPSGDQLEYNGYAWEPVGPTPLNYPIAIDKGGTGATSVGAARINLFLNNSKGQGIIILDGTVAEPAVGWNTEMGLGWYREGASKMAVASNGAKAFGIDMSATNATGAGFWPRSNGTALLDFYNFPAGTPNVNNARFGIDAAGNVLIGSGFAGTATAKEILATTPQLSVLGSLSANLMLRKTAGAGNTCQLLGAVGATNSLRWNVQLGDGNVEAGGNQGSHFAINRYSDAGVFLSAPMLIRRDNGNTQFAHGVYFGGSSGYGAALSGNNPVFSYSSNYYWTWDSASGHLAYIGGGNNRLRIRQSGEVDIYGNALSLMSDGSLALLGATNGPSYPRYLQFTTGYRLQCNMDTGFVYLIMNEATRAEWRTDGTFVNGGPAYKPGGGAWADSSDERIKDDITDYAHGLDELLQLRPRSYKFKAATKREPRTYIGLIAQEAEGAMPELVAEADLQIGDLHFDDMRLLDSSALTYALINAVKTLHERINQLENA